MDTLLITPEHPAADVFSRGELELLSGEGLLTPSMDRIWVPAARSGDLSMRLACARAVMPEALRNRAAVGWASAAWLHGWAPAPERLDVLVDQSRRTGSHLRGRGALVIHEVKDLWDRTQRSDGLYFTDPIRTVYDVARHGSDEIAAEALGRALTDRRLRSMMAVDQWLNRAPLPMRDRSRMRIRLREAGLDLRRQRSGAPVPSS